MNTALIVFASSTTGSRLKNLASREQIANVTITQTPKKIKTDGCSYSLRVNIDEIGRLLAIAQKYKVRYTAVYAEERDISGTIQYRKL